MKRLAPLSLLLLLAACGTPGAINTLDPAADIKVFVCKYVDTPGVDERLQTGDNPISVSINAIPAGAAVGAFFADAQGRSFVLAFDNGQPEPSPTSCPPPDDGGGTTTTTSSTTSTSSTTTSSTSTTTTCPDCGINTVVIIPTSTTLPPGTPTQQTVAPTTTTPSPVGATTTQPGSTIPPITNPANVTTTTQPTTATTAPPRTTQTTTPPPPSTLPETR